MRSIALAIISLVLTLGIANATVPDPDNCTVVPCDEIGGLIIYPDPIEGGYASFTVIVRNESNDPIPFAFAEIIFGVPANLYLNCPDLVLTGTTGATGSVTFNISAGGCSVGPYAVKIRANGVDIRTYENIKSPDYAGMGDGNVDLDDFIPFGAAMGFTGGCTDYFNDGMTGLEEFIVFGEAWGRTCNP
ncbi:MAG: hypothetical protein KAY24_11150 [Candidatus Eisenbacteria sp.]|nr:hypothetical protein [Candidatus Eisenbacteria bacterium]